MTESEDDYGFPLDDPDEPIVWDDQWLEDGGAWFYDPEDPDA